MVTKEVIAKTILREQFLILAKDLARTGKDNLAAGIALRAVVQMEDLFVEGMLSYVRQVRELAPYREAQLVELEELAMWAREFEPQIR